MVTVAPITPVYTRTPARERPYKERVSPNVTTSPSGPWIVGVIGPFQPDTLEAPDAPVCSFRRVAFYMESFGKPFSASGCLTGTFGPRLP